MTTKKRLKAVPVAEFAAGCLTKKIHRNKSEARRLAEAAIASLTAAGLSSDGSAAEAYRRDALDQLAVSVSKLANRMESLIED